MQIHRGGAEIAKGDFSCCRLAASFRQTKTFPSAPSLPAGRRGRLCGENLRQSEMRKLMFGLCLVMVLFGLSGCLFVYSQGPDCAVFGVYELHYHVPFYEYPPYPPPVYKPDAYGYWRWHHREWRWEPGV